MTAAIGRAPAQRYVAIGQRARGRKKSYRLGMPLNDYLGELLVEDTGIAYTPQEAFKTA